MKEQFKLLFEYEKWATGKVLDAMNKLHAEDEKCTDWMAHILLAQLIWYTRLLNDVPEFTPWEKKTFEDCLEMFEDNTRLWNEYCLALDERKLTEVISYKNTKGDTFKNSVKDILTHVINHSTYHRGQIIARLKGQLPSLPSTDYILFIREKSS